MHVFNVLRFNVKGEGFYPTKTILAEISLGSCGDGFNWNITCI